MAFDRLWHLPIVLSAILPIVLVAGTHQRFADLVNVIAWLVFVVDLVVHMRLIGRYLHTPRGRFDLVIVVLTAPWFLIPGFQGSAILTLARLGRLVRLAAVGPARNCSSGSVGCSWWPSSWSSCALRWRMAPSIRRTRASLRSATPCGGAS